jgi:hypothetical protein
MAGAPSPAREARALPRTRCHTLTKFAGFAAVLTFVGCETSNYAPPVTSQMVATSHGKRSADVSTLERGRTLFVHRCIECHTLPPMWKYSSDDWPKIVNDMSHRASLKPTERDAVVAYILAVRKNM